MIREAPLDERKHFARDRVGREAQQLRRCVALGQALAVLSVEIPAPALGLILAHQQAGFTPHLAVEILHAIAPPPSRPSGKTRPRGEETIVVADEEGNAAGLAPVLHLGEYAMFAGFGHFEPTSAVALQRLGELAVERPGMTACIQFDVVDLDPLFAESFSEAAHRGEHEDDLLLMVSDIGRLLRRLDHQHDVLLRIEIFERGERTRELVAEHEAQRLHDRRPPRRNSALQRSEQVFTSAQLARHFFRHSKGRPQAGQIFSGRSDFA